VKTNNVVVQFKRYVKTHPTAMLMSNALYEIARIEGAVFFEVQGEDGKKPRIVSVGDRVTDEQAYEISLVSHVVVEPVYPTN
jgi:hypothetical protein